MLTPVPITATASLGLLSVGVDMGTVTVAGRTMGMIDPAKAATGTLSFVDPGMGPAADGRITLGEILGDPLAIFGPVTFDGAAEINLPLTSPLIQPTDMPYVNVSWTDISDFGTIALDIDIAALIAFATDFDFSTALSGVGSIVDMIAGWVTDEILNTKLPYVDLTVGELFDYITTADSFFQAIILANPMTGVLFDQAVQGAIAAAGLNPANVTLTPSADPMLHDPMAATPKFFYDLVFDYDVMTSVPFGFDLGGGILTLDSMLQPTVAFDFALQFGLNEDDGFFIVDQGTAAGPELTLAAGLTLPIDLFGGMFGPLAYGVSNGLASLTADFDLDLVDPDSPMAGGRIGGGQLTANLLQVLDPALSGNGELRLPMGLRLGQTGPALLTNFTAFWNSSAPGSLTYGTVDGTATGAPLNSENVRDGFGPVLFELGEVMQEVIGPLLSEIAQFNPLSDDVQDVLTTTLPIVNKTPLELLGDVAGAENVALLFEIVAELTRFAGLIQGNAIDLTAYFSGEVAPANPGPGIEDINDAPANEQSSFFPFLDDLETKYNVSLPFLQDIGGSLISTLLGQEIDLIHWDPEGFEFSKTWHENLPIASIPILPLITIDFRPRVRRQRRLPWRYRPRADDPRVDHDRQVAGRLLYRRQHRGRRRSLRGLRLRRGLRGCLGHGQGRRRARGRQGQHLCGRRRRGGDRHLRLGSRSDGDRSVDHTRRAHARRQPDLR